MYLCDYTGGAHSTVDVCMCVCVIALQGLTALSAAACFRLCEMKAGLMRRDGSSFIREFMRATRAASLRASA